MAPIAAPDKTESGRVLSVRQSFKAMLGLCFLIMMVAIDQTVVGTAMPTIVAELNGFELYAWVATAYLLTSVITIPIFGRLGDYYGRKPFVVVSIVVFTVASILCGLSSTMLQLVLARALQGIGGGMLIGTAFACVPDLFPDTRVRLRWQVLLSASFGIANGIGPSLGGFLTQYMGWRSVFYVNVPIGLLSFWFVWRCLPHIRQMQAGSIRLDWPGALLIALGLGSLQLLVELLPAHGGSVSMVALGVFSVIAFVVLFYWERRCPEPLLPLEMFRNKSLAALFTLSFFTGFVMFALMFYAPLLFQGGFGLSPQAAGLLVTPLVAFITVGSIANSRVITRLSKSNMMLFIGFTLLAVGSTGLIFTYKTTPNWIVLLYMMLVGTGIGFIMPNLTIFAQEIVGRAHLGIATALLQSVRMIGGMLGMAVVGSMVSHYYASGVQGAVQNQDSASWLLQLQDFQVLVNHSVQTAFLERLHAMGIDAAPLIDLARQALVFAIHSGMWTVLFISLLGLVWARKVPPIRFSRGTSSKGGAGN